QGTKPETARRLRKRPCPIKQMGPVRVSAPHHLSPKGHRVHSKLTPALPGVTHCSMRAPLGLRPGQPIFPEKLQEKMMGKLIDGVWHKVWYDTAKTGGRFERAESGFRNWVTVDGAPGPGGKGG